MGAEFKYKSDFPEHIETFNFKLLNVEAIKDDCIYLLDTSALLTPFKTSAKSLSEIKKVYTKLKNEQRLFIPAQSIREFLTNRPTTLRDIHNTLYNKYSENFKFAEKYPFLEQVKEYSDLEEAKSQLNSAINNYKLKLQEIINIISSMDWNDPISEMYKEVFEGIILNDDKLNYKDLGAELERRNKENIPPGYKDKSKGINSGGDLTIWYEILEIAREKQKNLVFVSGDIKQDWVYTSNNKIMYPRMELIDEYRRNSGNKSFLMIDLTTLLKIFNSDAEIIKEIGIAENIDNSYTSFTKLSNRELKDNALDLVNDLRQTLHEYHRKQDQFFSPELNNFDQRSELYSSYSRDLMFRYEKYYKVNAILYRDELIKRLGFPKLEGFEQVLYEHPTNPIGLEQVTSSLEKLAKSLPLS